MRRCSKEQLYSFKVILMPHISQNATQKSQKIFVHVPSEIGAHEVEEIGNSCGTENCISIYGVSHVRIELSHPAHQQELHTY